VAAAVGPAALIFPAPDKPGLLEAGSGFNVANKILAEITGEPADVATKAHEALVRRRDDLRDAALKDVRAVIQSKDADAQIADLTEFYWAAVSYDGDYTVAREAVDALLAARKSTRTFAPVGAWAGSSEKSSLDGARESVISKGKTGDEQQMYWRYRARPHEYLSGVDLLKRLGKTGKQEDDHFPSTSHMAAIPLWSRLKKAAELPDVVSRWRAYLDILPPEMLSQEVVYHHLRLPLLGDLDGALLFESRLRDYLEGPELDAAALALRAVYRREEGEPDDGLKEPSPYYAILNGDGDFMGEAIRSLDTPDKNRDFSRTLAGFAAEARAIVANHKGAAVFTGGDDVLAFLPLHTAIPCAQALAKAFRERMEGYTYTVDGVEKSPSFSAGLIITHHLEPLEDALRLARRAERRAKGFVDPEKGKKNALTVVLDKRSGAPRWLTGRWGTVDQWLLELAELHRAELIPGRLAYQLQDTYLLLRGGNKANNGKIDAILEKEARRLVRRKRTGQGQAMAEEDRGALERLIVDSSLQAAAPEALVIAEMIAKAIDTAQGETVATPVAPKEGS
jgi:CRISPR-associated protein Cmr2